MTSRAADTRFTTDSSPGGRAGSERLGEPLLKSRRGWLMACVWTVCLALSAFSLWKATPPGSGGGQPEASAAVTSPVSLTSPGSQLLITRPIEEIWPGMRVLAENPEVQGADVPAPLEITDPENWRLFTLEQPKADGGKPPPQAGVAGRPFSPACLTSTAHCPVR